MALSTKQAPLALGAVCAVAALAETTSLHMRRETDGSTIIESPRYRAVVSADGCLSSLRISGVEFLQSTPHAIPRGLYLYQSGLYRLTGMKQTGPFTLAGEGKKARIAYRFSDAGIHITIENPTAEKLLYVGVFHPEVGVLIDQAGQAVKTPTQRTCSQSLWFRGTANVRFDGGTRVWGPWARRFQVWQADIAPGATIELDLLPGVASAREIAAAEAKAREAPPPPPRDPTGPMWNMKTLSVPPAVEPAPEFHDEHAEAVFFAGLPYQQHPTRIFAWIGMPKITPGKRVPGMVLVHGGGGTAFASWVRRWTRRGYAAIAMDTCGCVPKGSYGDWERHAAGGPQGWGGWDQIDQPREDQWTYHAVAAAILAHSLLRVQPGVDPDRIGLTGISWGGYLTCILAGVDHRFRCAIPVYGCGFTNEHTFAAQVNALGTERAARWMRWWDPSVYLPEASLPMLWVNGSNDFAYTLNAWQKSYRLPKGPRTLCLRLRMPHGHGDAGEGPEEIFTFADSVLKNGTPLPRLTGQGCRGRNVWATFDTRIPIEKAELNVTADDGPWPERRWEALPAVWNAREGRCTATLPENTRVYYLNVFDQRQCVVSSEPEILEP